MQQKLKDVDYSNIAVINNKLTNLSTFLYNFTICKDKQNYIIE